MTPKYTLKLDDPQAKPDWVGGKGASLAHLSSTGIPVPAGFHVTTAAYRKFEDDNSRHSRILEILKGINLESSTSLEQGSKSIREIFEEGTISPEIAAEIVEAYDSLPGREPAVAVRSSATAEDLPEASFAGQQETYLNVSGASAVLKAVKKCWGSLWTARAISYRVRQGIDQSNISLAVVIQLLVPAEASGILFTVNPVTGNRDEMVISASWGLGEAIVSGKVTPDHLILDKTSGQVIKRETADKAVMTICSNRGTEEKPVPDNLRHVPVLDDESASELARLVAQIETIYALPMDIEWAKVDDKFTIIQARPITALPKPEPPIKWRLPKGAYSALRNNIVELMAEPLTPLFGTLGLEAINASMRRTMASVFGKSGLMPDEIIITVNDYAYYNGSLKPGQIIRILFSGFSVAKFMFSNAIERWTKEGRPRYVSIVEHWESQPWRDFSSAEILVAVRELTEAAIDAYMALVSGVIPASWITEGWFTGIYKLLIKRRGDPPASTFLLGFDSLPIQSEKSLYTLSEWIRNESELMDDVIETPAPQIAAQIENDQVPANVDSAEDWYELQRRFKAYLKRYGYTIYNLDFANPVPADDPVPLLETIKLFASGEGVNPYERQQAAAERREETTQSILNRLKGWRRKLFQKRLEAAQRYAPLREDGLADVGFSYPLVRQMLREIGTRLVKGNMIDTPDQIFWLGKNEVEEGAMRVDRGESLENKTQIIRQRKVNWRAVRRVSPPRMLPQIKVPGIDLARVKSIFGKRTSAKTLKGVAASPGTIIARARVLHGPEDFNQMMTGEILVAAMTTPAWTPLFARASAVVTDVGGPLSHGSIVAREYGIPAVLGTNVATARIHSGQILKVDGDKGEVTISDNGG